ncbi:hypothetical protein J6G99_05655 [bacterium]|nr:hypothetical protein [bacterium]
MNFLEIINKCLLELNYKPVNTFGELIKNDHKKIKTILNIINKEICNIELWDFLLRRTNLTIPANTQEIENPINGRILYLFIDGEKYKFQQDIEEFLTGQASGKKYSMLNNKLLFPKFKQIKTADIVYYTKNCVINSNNEEQEEFISEDDASLIPMPFAEQLLVYGTCLRLKANPSYIRFSYWMSMYKDALLNLKSKTSIDANNSPIVKLHRI